MFSSTRKCWPSSFFGAMLTADRTRAWRCRRPARRARPASSPRARASASKRVHDVRGLVRPPAQRLGREVRRVGLGEDAVERDLRRGDAQLRRVLVRRVAGERDVVPAVERGRERGRIGEAVQHDGSVEGRELLEHGLVGGAVVDHDRLPELGGQPELLPEERAAGGRAGRSRERSRGRSRRPRPRVGGRADLGARRGRGPPTPRAGGSRESRTPPHVGLRARARRASARSSCRR